MMTETQTQILKSTLSAVQEHGLSIATVFYKHLLEQNPELAPMFATGDQENGKQAERLAAAILAYVGNIDRLNLLGPAVTNISRRHVATGVKPEHYPIVGRHLLEAIRQVLAGAATPEILDAWAAAYQQLADIMIEREQAMYAGRP
jgi:nitric oxide dioxygenase